MVVVFYHFLEGDHGEENNGKHYTNDYGKEHEKKAKGNNQQ